MRLRTTRPVRVRLVRRLLRAATCAHVGRDRRGPVVQHGQAIAELAIVAPVLLLLMLVAVDFGRLFFSYIAVQNAAREAANYAALHAADTPYDPALYAAAVAAAGVRETNAQAQGGAGTLTVSAPSCFDPATAVTLDCHAASDFAAGIGNQVTVSANQPFTFLTPLIGDLFFGGQVNLSASSTAPVMNPPDTTILAGPTLPPVATPSPSPSPSPSPVHSLPPGASPLPSSSPSPSPSPTPIPMCEVPDLDQMYYNDLGLLAWQVAGFTGALEDRTAGDQINDQDPDAHVTVPCSTDGWVDDE